jgi:hypothetical protein
VPDTAAIEAMIGAAFWASLRREEGYMPRISLAYVAVKSVKWPLIFERRLPLAAQPLTRLGPAVERPGIHLGVWREGGEFVVWGATRDLPPFCAVLEVIAPGLLVVKHSRDNKSEKFANVAVLQGNEVKIIDGQFANLPNCPDLLTSLLPSDTQHSSESASVLIRIAVSMRAHGRGGSLLVVPSKTELWRKSLVQPIHYSLVPPFSGLAALTEEIGARSRQRRWMDALQHAVDGVAGLTAVDGATVINDKYEVLAFGAKIVRRDGSSQISEVIVTEPIEGARPQVVHLSNCVDRGVGSRGRVLGVNRHSDADRGGALSPCQARDAAFWARCLTMKRNRVAVCCRLWSFTVRMGAPALVSLMVPQSGEETRRIGTSAGLKNWPSSRLWG